MAAEVLVVGGTSGLGYELAKTYRSRGANVTITGRDEGKTGAVAADCGDGVRSIALDLAEPQGIAEALAGLERIDRLALLAVDRDQNTVTDYDVDQAIRLVTLKLVGYTEVVHQLAGRFWAGRVDPPLRRAREGPPVPGLDHGVDCERCRLDDDPDDGARARAGARQRHPPRDRGRHALLGRQDEHCENVRARTPTGGMS